jgi:hypothetical protein
VGYITDRVLLLSKFQSATGAEKRRMGYEIVEAHLRYLTPQLLGVVPSEESVREAASALREMAKLLEQSLE